MPQNRKHVHTTVFRQYQKLTIFTGITLCIFTLVILLSVEQSVAQSVIGDVDRDGVADTIDIDDDNDGVLDIFEITELGNDRDVDADGVPDRLDLDSDGDGILDLEESGVFRTDAALILRFEGGRIRGEMGANGYADLLETAPDSDIPDFNLVNSDAQTGDLLPDFLDLDSDNDGLIDLVEGGIPVSLDANQDGRIDVQPGEVGIDGIPDQLQLEVDKTCCDFDGDGSEDDTPVNTDGADFPDFQDLDSDNDGISDLVESGALDFDVDGFIDGFLDDPMNPDGVDDAFLSVPPNPADQNGDGVPDHLDPSTQFVGENHLPAPLPENPAVANDPASIGTGVIETGLKGSGGCALSHRAQGMDPFLPLLMLIAVIAVIRRGQRLR